MAVILKTARPVLAFRADEGLEKSQAFPEWADLLTTGLSRIETAARSVGRVEAVDHPTLTWLGAAFVVAPGMVMTTRHIADVFLNERDGRYQIKPDIKVRVRFSDERESTTRFCPIVDCALRHPVLDVAILRFSDDSGEALPPLTFEGVGLLTEGMPLAVIAFFFA